MLFVLFYLFVPIVGPTPETARQLASRARRRVRGAPEPDADLHAQRRVVEAFLAASRAGDFGARMEVLDPDVVFRADSGGWPGIVVAHIEGAEAVARNAVLNGSRWARWCQPALVNGQWGCVVIAPRRPIGVAGMTVSGGRIASIELILDPAKIPADAARGAAGAFGMRKFS